MFLSAKLRIYTLLVFSLLFSHKALSSEPSDISSTNFQVPHQSQQYSLEEIEPATKRRPLDSSESVMHEAIPFKIPSFSVEEFRQKEEIIQAYLASGLAHASKVVSTQDPKGTGEFGDVIDKLLKRFEQILSQDLEMAFPELEDWFNQYEEQIKLNENKILSMTLDLNTLRQTILSLSVSCGYLEELYNQASCEYYKAAEDIKDQNPLVAKELYKKQANLLERYLSQKRQPISILVMRYYGDACLNIAVCSMPSDIIEANNFCDRAIFHYNQFLEFIGDKAEVIDYQNIIASYLSAKNYLSKINPTTAKRLKSEADKLKRKLKKFYKVNRKNEL